MYLIIGVGIFTLKFNKILCLKVFIKNIQLKQKKLFSKIFIMIGSNF